MFTIHSTLIAAKCPKGAHDVYEAEFHVAGRVVEVETIAAVIAGSTTRPIYQEDLTQSLADALTCKVVTKGSHGEFSTTCTAEPAA